MKRKLKINNSLGYFSDWLDKLYITRLLGTLGNFALILTIILFIFETQNMEHSRTVAAWQLLTTKASGNSGKIEALEYLNKEEHDLRGIDLSVPIEYPMGVYLRGAELPGVNFSRSNLTFVNLSEANLVDSYLYRVNLNNSSLSFANLTGSNLKKADLTCSTLTGANLKNANLYKTNLFKVNILDVKNLTCGELKSATNWKTATRSPNLSCGESIPKLDTDACLSFIPSKRTRVSKNNKTASSL
ncbi:pentapeptide repeat-containing protein [Vibrio parahaemolyticus]|uniref:pentapeptide repeat-containing protein n=2 Tax=Vibrio parahaemolyticus TaxID=670 RepID=UPI0023628F53|nr:pentapeptide repeat-containing protein [Vibrio parahaemolyticus]